MGNFRGFPATWGPHGYYGNCCVAVAAAETLKAHERRKFWKTKMN
jgi:hypothetical protein